MRNVNGKNVELLAPAGNFDIFKSIVKSKCDAIYLGGQAFNMRMIRKGFNFTNEELVKARKLASDNKKKLYITVNNLIEEEELKDLEKYLRFLEGAVKPDALIVQDMAVVALVNTLGLELELHASVMMNVHNLDMIKKLEAEGVTRVVLSREMSLEQVKYISERTDVELEYFTHGDMCIAHGSQCYYSSILFGMSSNRGRCLKPCRWWFKNEERSAETILTNKDANTRDFPLAVKDLALYRHLPDLIEAGVHSLKIEGRMREKEFITKLTNTYGVALDNYIVDSISHDTKGKYDPNEKYDVIESMKKRDFSLGYAFGNPGAENINSLHEGSGKFYSTGKMFSTPTPEKNVALDDKVKIESEFDGEIRFKNDKAKYKASAKVSIKVQNFKQAESAIQNGANRIYIAGDVYLPDTPLSKSEFKQIRAMLKVDQELYLTSPRMLTDKQKRDFLNTLTYASEFIDGLLVTQMGVLDLTKEVKGAENLKLAGDYSLNVFNSQSGKWYKKNGLRSVTASIEMNAKQFKVMSDNLSGLELIVFGKLASMYFDHDFHSVHKTEDSHFNISNEAGKYTILKDQFSRTHLLTTHNINLTSVVDSIIYSAESLSKNLSENLNEKSNIEYLRIEAQTMSAEEIEKVITQVKKHESYVSDHDTFGAFRF